MNSTILASIAGTAVHWDGHKLSWLSGAHIDADGSPRAYGPNNSGLDYTANAGHPGNWYGIATDDIGRPFIQGACDPCPGMYVSTTAYENPAFVKSDPRRYLNSEEIPYIVIPGHLRTQVPGIVLGCKAEVTHTHTGVCVTAIVGDIGPSDEIGEISIKLADMLGIPSGPRTGGIGTRSLAFEVFPGVPVRLNGLLYRLIPSR